MSGDLLLTWYGDDFTGSTDVMEALALNGVPAVLFLRPPRAQDLTGFAGVRAIGLAGTSRSRTPEWMTRELPAVFESLRALGAPLCHYKVCSTFDSAPRVGSIGRAIEIGRSVFGALPVPLIVGAPALRRYTAFGNLFATFEGETWRIDRHPVMSVHPVTPMAEADLRRHLGAQTDLDIALVDILALRSAGLERRVDEVLAAHPGVVLFDVLDEASLGEAGRLVWERRAPGCAFVAGSSGLEYALVAHWRAAGVIPPAPAPPRAAPAERIAVVCGSCSPVTERQIRWARDNGYASVELDARALASSGAHQPAVQAACDAAGRELRAGRSVVLYSALGRGAGFVAPEAGADGAFNRRLGERLGVILRTLIERESLTRVVVAGGDTSGHATRQLDVHALTLLAPLAPGGPLCRAHSHDARLDGLEIVLKGGQVGDERFFDAARAGNAGSGGR